MGGRGRLGQGRETGAGSPAGVQSPPSCPCPRSHRSAPRRGPRRLKRRFSLPPRPAASPAALPAGRTPSSTRAPALLPPTGRPSPAGQPSFGPDRSGPPAQVSFASTVRLVTRMRVEHHGDGELVQARLRAREALDRPSTLEYILFSAR